MPKEIGRGTGEERIEDLGQLEELDRSRGTIQERALLIVGAALLVAGAALALLPTVAPQQAWIVQKLASRGLTNIPSIAAGVLLIGLWLTVRTSRAHSIAAQESIQAAEEPLQGLVEAIGRQGDSLQGLRIELVYLKDLVNSQSDRLQASASNSNGADGMFRLAASLDQLGARIEERINANHREVCESLQYVCDRVESTRSQGNDGRLLLGEHASIDGAEEQDALAGQDLAWTARGIDAEDADERPRLGLLDLLDDLGRILPRKTSPAVERPETPGLDFEDVHDEGWKHHASIPAPLPSARNSEEIRLTGPGELLAGGNSRNSGETQVVSKLEELRSLLADDRVREALAAIERERR